MRVSLPFSVVLCGLVVALAALCPALAQPASTAWPMAYHDNQRTGRATACLDPTSPSLAWAMDLSDEVAANVEWGIGPIVGGDDRIFTAISLNSNSFTVFAHDRTDGTLLWNSTFAEVAVYQELALDKHGHVLVPVENGTNGTLLALNEANGELEWQFDTVASLDSAPVIDSDGTIFLVDYDGTFYAVNSANGAEVLRNDDLKSREDGLMVYPTPTLNSDGSRLVFLVDRAAGNHMLVSLNTNTGAVVANYTLEDVENVDPGNALPYSSDTNFVYIPSADHLRAVNIDTMEVEWVASPADDASGNNFLSLTHNDDVLWARGELLYVVDGETGAFLQNTTAPHSEAFDGYSHLPSVAVGDDTTVVLAQTEANTLYAINAYTGDAAVEVDLAEVGSNVDNADLKLLEFPDLIVDKSGHVYFRLISNNDDPVQLVSVKVGKTCSPASAAAPLGLLLTVLLPLVASWLAMP